MRKLLIGFMVLLVIAAGFYFRFRHARGSLGVAYAGNRDVTLWNTMAQVREPVATLKYGERLEIIQRSQDQVRVRTASGAVGWTEEGELLSADVWLKAKDLDGRAASSPLEARGHTHAISNLRVEPGRESPRIEQLGKSVPLELYERAVITGPVPTAAAPTPAGGLAPTVAAAAEAKKEDWWLVRAHLPDGSTTAGWILGRFIDLDVPSPLPDYASAAGMHIVAWFELDRVADGSGGSKPQYLVVGTRGPEGQPCDFTLLRVYTWGARRMRYETAYVESNLCGKVPVKLERAAAAQLDVTFSFEDSSDGAPEARTYVMHQTVVRRVRQAGSVPTRRKHARG